VFLDNNICAGKIAIVVSPQSWGTMFISKHHYAVELAKLGYTVYFINPPKEKKIGSLPNVFFLDTEHDNLKVVYHTLFFSSYFKFHVPFLHHLLILLQRKFILRKIGFPDLIMSFDLTNNFPLKGLKCKKIFFAADEPRTKQNFVSARNADLIVSVSQHILDLYEKYFPKIKKLLINHGLSEEFLDISENLPKKYDGINIGLSGNFLFNDIDYPVMLQIVAENPEVTFHFYGNHSIQSNIGADSSQSNLDFLEQIKISANCIFHGILCKRELALELNQMDGFLICYDPQKGQSSGSNSHKILEFLSTGKVIFSSYFSFYDGTDLFVMNSNKQSNSALVKFFKQGQNEFKVNNSASSISKRKDFAIQRSYDSNLKKIMSVKLPIPSCAE
jgi:hypothetical protein